MNFIETFELKNEEYIAISNLISERYGINLHNGKKELVRARLCKLLRKGGFEDFSHYIKSVLSDKSGAEISKMVDAITTNVTDFFREYEHFNFLKKELLPELLNKKNRENHILVWSAGCSTGKEPYSIAMTIHDTVEKPGDWDIKILATDICRTALKKASAGVYDKKEIASISLIDKQKYFEKLSEENYFKVSREISTLVYFRYLNLNGNWPLKNTYDFIFCRNVMIYFDHATQNKLIQKFRDHLNRDGYLFLGHSESLKRNAGGFKYIAPAVYRKVD